MIGGDGPQGVAGCNGAGGARLIGIGTCTGIEGASDNSREDHGPQPTPPVYACSFHPRRIKDGRYFPNRQKARSCGSVLCWPAEVPARRRGQARRLDCRGAYFFWFVGRRFIQKVVTTGDSRPVLQDLAYHGRSLRCRGQTFRAVCTPSCRVRRGSATKAFMGSSCPYPTFLYGSWWAYSAMAPRSISFSSAMYRSIACLNLGWRISCAL